MFAISTSWNSSRHTEGENMVDELKELGFRQIELGHGIRVSQIEGVLKRVEKRKIQVMSLHNFCPMPVEIMGDSPDCYTFTSHRETDRKRAIKLTFQTIDYAQRLGAKYVVLHGGTVPMKDYTTPLLEMVAQGELNTKHYAALKIEALAERWKQGKFYVERTVEALKAICDYAGERGVKLGLESRDTIEHIPFETEFDDIFDAVGAPNLGYWHDWGHTHIKHNLSLLDHRQWLERWGPRAFGSHIQDVIWPDHDHRAPFMGEIDFDTLMPLLAPDAHRVWELSPRIKKADLLACKETWDAKFELPQPEPVEA
jgi:sugar phosphate isomerase/epimerase